MLPVTSTTNTKMEAERLSPLRRLEQNPLYSGFQIRGPLRHNPDRQDISWASVGNETDFTFNSTDATTPERQRVNFHLNQFQAGMKGLGFT